MRTLTDLRAAMRTRHQQRRRLQQLRRDLLEYRTSAECHELQAILGRYDTTVDDLLTGLDPPRSAAEPGADIVREAVWETDLDLTPDE
jgi:hypothetical protein